MKKIIRNINRVLAEWNPIGVDMEIAKEEYKGYIPVILKSIENQNELMICLENILINKLEVGYDPINKEHLEDLQKVCSNLIRAYNEAKI